MKKVAKIAAAQRVQEIADRASLVAQQRVAAEEEEQRVIRETQVEQTPRAQSEQVDSEARRRNPYVGRRRRRKGSQKSAGEHGAAADSEPHQFDVTV